MVYILYNTNYIILLDRLLFIYADGRNSIAS